MSFPPAIAPYAQAAAVVKGDGTVLRSQGVVDVQRTGVGSYYVKVSNDIEMDKAVPVATLVGRVDSSEPTHIYVNPHDTGGDPHTFGVTTYVGTARVDNPFTV